MRKFGVICSAVIVVGLLFILFTYTGTTSAYEDQRKAWGQVENAYETRASKIPNLVSVTKGYAQHEKAIWEAFAAARARVDATKAKYDENKGDSQARKDYDAANVQLTTAIQPILTLQERYPEIKADKQFLRLTDEISSTENTIRVERKRFNEAVGSYNKRVAFGGGLFGFSKVDYYQADPASHKAPKVEF